jgi:hypothetical protein
LAQIGEKFEPHHQIFLAHIDRFISHLVIGLDKEIDTKESISSFGLRLRRFSKEEVSGVKEKDLSTLFFYLRDKCRFLGDTTKRAPESPAGLDLTHHIIGVDDAELDSGCGFDEGSIGQVCKESCNQKKMQSFEFQLDPTLFQSNKTIFGDQERQAIFWIPKNASPQLG